MPTPTRIRFAKLIATPHETSWSQAYNAGGLFIVFSLSLTEPKAENTLNATGKDIVNNIEAEFFGLEEKTLDTIAEALTEALKDIDPDITLNLCLAYNKDDILYVFLKGSGKIIIKREGRIGALLQGTERDILKKASGRLKDDDKLLLATHAFTTHFSDEHIEKALAHDDPERGIEGLIPHLQDTKNGEIASLLLSYHETSEETPPYALPTEQHVLTSSVEEEKNLEESEVSMPRTPDESVPEPEKEQEEEPAYAVPLENDTRSSKRKLTFPKVSLGNIPLFRNKRFLMLIVALILVLILGISVFRSVQKKTTTTNNTLFHTIYDSAQKSYDEGTSLESLNKALAHDDFVKADEKLKEADGKFAPGSSEQQQIDDLKKKVADKLRGTSSTHPVDAKTVDDTTVPVLKVAKDTSPLGLATDGNTIYTLSSKAVTKNDSGKSTDSIKNDSDWSDGVGLGVYLGNIYVLDKAKGVLKFPSASDGFGKAVSYFTGTAPDMSKALGMAIDGSVWILTSEGNILKFTRGASDSVKISGLTSPLGSQGNIVTSADMSNIYVLDGGNGRIVKFDKTGAYQAEYANSNLKGARFFTIDEKNNKADVLSSGKIYELSLK